MPRAAPQDRPGPWDTWLANNGARLLLYARQQTRTESDAEDVLQSALIKTWKTTNQNPGANLNLTPLAFTNIRRCAIDLARANSRRQSREEKIAQPPVAWFDASLESKERALEIQAALQQLSPDFREVITLKIWGDLTFAQIAAVLEISPNTAASRYRYALKSLRTTLSPDLQPLHPPKSPHPRVTA
ncbi:MAG: sigma-70 family RNA polymerase sigma factor [Verrucomicrobiota bacterium]